MEPIFGTGLLTAPGKIYLNIKQKYVYIKYILAVIKRNPLFLH